MTSKTWRQRWLEPLTRLLRGDALSQRQRKLGPKSRFQRLELELLESRILLKVFGPTAIWINPNSGNWDVASNWSSGAVPGAFDNVAISTTSAATITIQSGDAESAQSLTTAGNDTLSITGGSLTVAAGSVFLPSSTLSGGLAITGGSFTASEAGTVVTINNTAICSGTNFFST